MLIVVALVTVLAAGVLWLELVIRAALLYVGALLGTVVYAGLVDRNMWGHVRRWAGIMIAVILVKPVIVVVLGLAGALAGDKGPNAFSAVVSGLAIILLAIFASAMIYRFVPGFGDEIASARSNRSKATDGAQAAAVISSPASLVSQGIKTHSSRGGGAHRAAWRLHRRRRQPDLRRHGRPQQPRLRQRVRRRNCPLRRTPAPHWLEYEEHRKHRR